LPRSLPASHRAFREDLRAVLVLVAICAVVFWPWLFAGQAFYWGDIGLYFLPQARFLGENLQQGIVPLWNPDVFCGLPFVGNAQASPFYPATALLWFLPPAVYLMVVNVLHLWLAGVGLYLFLRRGQTQGDSLPSLFGATAFMLGGFLVSKTQFPNMVQALAYVPFILLATERLAENVTPRRVVYLGIFIGLQILAVHAQISVFTFYLALLYGVACLLWNRNLTRHYLRRLLPSTLLAVAVALGVSCVFWLPTVEAMRFVERQNLGIAEAHRFYLLPAELTNLFWPLRYGSPLAGNWSAPGTLWEKACYVGVLPMILALAGVAGAFTRTPDANQKRLRFWLFIGFVSLLLALGWQGGLYLLAYYVAPGIKLFHDPARMLLGVAIAVPVLAALGLQTIFNRLCHIRANVWACLVLLLVVADLGLFSHMIYPLQSVRAIDSMRHEKTIRQLRDDPDIEAGRARIFFSDPDRNRHFVFNYGSYFSDDPQYLAKWPQTVMGNFGMLFDLPQAGGYEPMAPRVGKQRATEADKLLPSASQSAAQGAAYVELLSKMSVKYLAIYSIGPLPNTPGLELVGQGDNPHDGYRSWIYRNTSFVPRAHWLKPAPSIINNQPAVDSTTANLQKFSIVPSPQARHFVLNDSFAPGWRAYLDGKQLQIVATEDGFQSVEIPSSSKQNAQRLTFVYSPACLTLATFITLATLLCLSAWGCSRFRRRPNAQAEA